MALRPRSSIIFLRCATIIFDLMLKISSTCQFRKLHLSTIQETTKKCPNYARLETLTYLEAVNTSGNARKAFHPFSHHIVLFVQGRKPLLQNLLHEGYPQLVPLRQILNSLSSPRRTLRFDHVDQCSRQLCRKCL